MQDSIQFKLKPRFSVQGPSDPACGLRGREMETYFTAVRACSAHNAHAECTSPSSCGTFSSNLKKYRPGWLLKLFFFFFLSQSDAQRALHQTAAASKRAKYSVKGCCYWCFGENTKFSVYIAIFGVMGHQQVSFYYLHVLISIKYARVLSLC